MSYLFGYGVSFWRKEVVSSTWRYVSSCEELHKAWHLLYRLLDGAKMRAILQVSILIQYLSERRVNLDNGSITLYTVEGRKREER